MISNPGECHRHPDWLWSGATVSVACSLLTSKGSHSPSRQQWAARSFQPRVWADNRNFQLALRCPGTRLRPEGEGRQPRQQLLWSVRQLVSCFQDYPCSWGSGSLPPVWAQARRWEVAPQGQG